MILSVEELYSIVMGFRLPAIDGVLRTLLLMDGFDLLPNLYVPLPEYYSASSCSIFFNNVIF